MTYTKCQEFVSVLDLYEIQMDRKGLSYIRSTVTGSSILPEWRDKYFITKLAFTCPKSTIETLKKGDKMFKVDNKNNRTSSLTSFWCFYC